MPFIEALPRLASWVIPLIILAIIILPQAIRILREYERGVIFRLGKLLGAKGPGLIFLIPIVDRMVRMDLRVVTIDVARQEVMTRDNVPVSVDAVLYFRVVDPQAAVVKVENFLKATSLIAQTTLRSVLGQAELDELLAHRKNKPDAPGDYRPANRSVGNQGHRCRSKGCCAARYDETRHGKTG
jgi:regulator of protease activity HflC (stomatin/prohibitin superfamily)